MGSASCATCPAWTLSNLAACAPCPKNAYCDGRAALPCVADGRCAVTGCAKGYAGVLCNACAWGYYVETTVTVDRGSQTCQKCPDGFYEALGAMLGLVCVLVLIPALIYVHYVEKLDSLITACSGHQDHWCRTTFRLCSARQKKIKRGIHWVMHKRLIFFTIESHISRLILLNSVSSVPFPDILRRLLFSSAASFGLNPDVAKPECTLVSWNILYTWVAVVSGSLTCCLLLFLITKKAGTKLCDVGKLEKGNTYIIAYIGDKTDWKEVGAKPQLAYSEPTSCQNSPQIDNKQSFELGTVFVATNKGSGTGAAREAATVCAPWAFLRLLGVFLGAVFFLQGEWEGEAWWGLWQFFLRQIVQRSLRVLSYITVGDTLYLQYQPSMVWWKGNPMHQAITVFAIGLVALGFINLLLEVYRSKFWQAVMKKELHETDPDSGEVKYTELTDADFAHFKGIHSLSMSGCNQATITDAAFQHLTGIQTLDMSGCNQDTVTDAAFVRLKGIRVLNMSGCNQATITDAAFQHLTGIQTLDMSGCNQATITEAAFAHLVGIKSLNMTGCSNKAVAAAQKLNLPAWQGGNSQTAAAAQSTFGPVIEGPIDEWLSTANLSVPLVARVEKFRPEMKCIKAPQRFKLRLEMIGNIAKFAGAWAILYGPLEHLSSSVHLIVIAFLETLAILYLYYSNPDLGTLDQEDDVGFRLEMNNFLGAIVITFLTILLGLVCALAEAARLNAAVGWVFLILNAAFFLWCIFWAARKVYTYADSTSAPQNTPKAPSAPSSPIATNPPVAQKSSTPSSAARTPFPAPAASPSTHATAVGAALVPTSPASTSAPQPLPPGLPKTPPAGSLVIRNSEVTSHSPSRAASSE